MERNGRRRETPAGYYRGGTSRAIVFQQKHLPQDRSEWTSILLGAVGSPDPNGRQLDGLGGGISSLSKICIVGLSSHPEADVDYAFAAIGVKDSKVGYSSNFGNMTSATGNFAVDDGIVDASEDGEVTVVIHNTNTRSGSKTRKLLLTGNTTDIFNGAKATCIDAGNPCVFINAKDVRIDSTIPPKITEPDSALLSKLDLIRLKASVAMGTSKDEASTPDSIPKIAMLSKMKQHFLLSGETIDVNTVDLLVRALSVGQRHRAVPTGVAMAAANNEGSIVHSSITTERVDPDSTTIGHLGGKILIGAKFDTPLSFALPGGF